MYRVSLTDEERQELKRRAHQAGIAPSTRDRVHRADEQRENGLGGPHGADLYLELAPGYYWDSDAESGPVAEASEPFTTGIHGVPTIDNDAMQGYAVLGGEGLADGGVAESARSTVLTPTAMRAVELEPPADATGTPQQDWLAE